jgi:hypothetical protein
MNEEILRIMKMLEEGKINADQAASLVNALNGQSSNQQPRKNMDEKRNVIENDMTKDQIPGQKMLQVRVLSGNGDKVKVNLPLNFVKGILKATGSIPVINNEHIQGLDMKSLSEAIINAIENDLTGRIVDVESGNDDLVIVEIVG